MMNPVPQKAARMFGEGWFHGARNHNSEGDLAAQVLRLVGAGAIYLIPCVLIAAFSFKLLLPPWNTAVPTITFAVWFLIFVLLHRTMLRVFSAQPEKVLDPVLFKWLIGIVVVVAGFRTLFHEPEFNAYLMMIDLFSFVVGICAILFLLTALLARCRVPFGHTLTCLVSGALALREAWKALNFLWQI